MAHAQVTVPFQNAGQVKAINVKVGDTVKTGQMLASLDTTDLEVAVALAQAGLDMAQAKLAAAKKAPLPSEIQAALAALTSAQAEYRAAGETIIALFPNSLSAADVRKVLWPPGGRTVP